MKIREATRADLTAIVALLAEDKLGQHREDTRAAGAAAYAAAFEEMALNPAVELLVMEAPDGEVVGTRHLSWLRFLT